MSNVTEGSVAGKLDELLKESQDLLALVIELHHRVAAMTYAVHDQAVRRSDPRVALLEYLASTPTARSVAI
jgi:uncharacterized protein (UPF0276 family)